VLVLDGEDDDDDNGEIDNDVLELMQQMDKELKASVRTKSDATGNDDDTSGELPSGLDQDDATANLLEQLLNSLGETGSDSNPFRSLLAMAQRK
jgi:hypothetical protein